MPPRKRKRGKGSYRMVEDDDEAIDIVTHETIVTNTPGGPSRQRKEVPLRPLPNLGSRGAPQEDTSGIPQEDMDFPMLDNVDGGKDFDEQENANKQQTWMEEFKRHSDLLLQSLLAREALPNEGLCMQCTSHRRAIWRCMDCTMPKLLCRFCMRQSHRENPLHNVQCWTGTFFRSAGLWEVGTYILVPHHMGTGLGNCLSIQMDILERLQMTRDEEEQDELKERVMAGKPAPDTRYTGNRAGMDPDGMGGGSEEDVYEEDNELAQIGDYLTQGYLGASEGGPIPRHDAFNNQYVRIVHTNGVHHRALVTCLCQGTDSVHADLMYCRLVPATFSRYRTLFTVSVLDDFRLSNLECKASAYQYFQKLRRLTSPMAPEKAPNLYQELLRMVRLWRWLKKKKWSGHGNGSRDGQALLPGELAIFCPTCPQPGVNLRADWKDDPNRWVYRRMFVADGNMKADHVRQKYTSDVWLDEGSGMFAMREKYHAFLKSAMERLTIQKAPCQAQFRAVDLAMQGSKACDITGIVAIACARHGCFAPNAVADLFKGEQQKNVDWVLLQALKCTNIDPGQGAILIYDIACQYFVHLQDRIGHLLPATLNLDAGIGMFHVHGHKEECLFRYATSFIPGVGVTVGEILEMLWSNLNSITPTVRTATLANRAETIDDHANDSNHKKLLNIATVLCNRYQQATQMASDSKTYFSKIAESARVEDCRLWERDIQSAEACRSADPAAMDTLRTQQIYAADVLESMPNQASNADAEEWIQMAINIEEQQTELQCVLDHVGDTAQETELHEINQLSNSLSAEFASLEQLQKAVSGMSGNLVDIDAGEEDATMFDIVDSEIAKEGDLNDPETAIPSPNATMAATVLPVAHLPAISRPIPLPSNATALRHHYNSIELRLRQQQAMRHLSALRELIAEKSFQYSHVIRVAPRKSIKTRARSEIKKINDKISFHCRCYTKCRSALVRLDPDPRTLSVFQVITRDDVKSSTALLDPNRSGSTTLRLSWIWQTGPSANSTSRAAVREFQRIHYLHARARKMRWEEEVILVAYEMEWTVRFFLYQKSLWDGRITPATQLGPAAYAARKSAMWYDMAKNANTQFSNVNIEYQSLC